MCPAWLSFRTIRFHLALGHRARGLNRQPDNNALERTRRVGVPAARAVVRVSPRRSTRCWTDARRGGLDDRDSGILPLSSVTQEES